LNLTAGHAHPVEQQLQVELRMRLLTAIAFIWAQRIPFLLRHDLNEA